MDVLLRPAQVNAFFNQGKTKTYEEVKAQLLPPWIKSGPRMVCMPQSELELVMAARIAGQTEQEIKVLVGKLVARRQEKFASLLAAVQ